MNKTHCQRILTHLQTGKSLTPLEALDQFGCFRLGARIWDLKREGHAIVATKVKLPNGKCVASYALRKAEGER